MTNREQKIYRLIRKAWRDEQRCLTDREISAATGIPVSSCGWIRRNLIDSGKLVMREGKHRDCRPVGVANRS